MSDAPTSRRPFRFYGDINCPFCFALGETLRSAGLLPRIDWRGIEHAPEAEAPWRPLKSSLRAIVEVEIEAIRRRFPQVEISTPPGIPNTHLALLATADALRRGGMSLAHEVRTTLQRRLFRQAQDISMGSIVDAARSEHRLPPLAALSQLEHQQLEEILASWRSEWQGLESRIIPTIVGPDGAVRRGLGEPSDLLQFVNERLQPD